MQSKVASLLVLIGFALMFFMLGQGANLFEVLGFPSTFLCIGTVVGAIPAESARRKAKHAWLAVAAFVMISIVSVAFKFSTTFSGLAALCTTLPVTVYAAIQWAKQGNLFGKTK